MSALRIGYGEDAHALEERRRLVLGGVEVPSPLGARAHSDGDVLLHALCDALLSTHALGDIGDLFPPGDARFRDVPSGEILRAVLDRLREAAGPVSLVNVAAAVTLDAPKLGPHRGSIQDNVARALGVASGRVGVSFKTSEGLAPRHVQARVSVLVEVPATRDPEATDPEPGPTPGTSAPG